MEHAHPGVVCWVPAGVGARRQLGVWDLYSLSLAGIDDGRPEVCSAWNSTDRGRSALGFGRLRCRLLGRPRCDLPGRVGTSKIGVAAKSGE